MVRLQLIEHLLRPVEHLRRNAGQTRDVELFNVIATDAREGEVLHVLLDNFVKAANLLNGRMFDSLIPYSPSPSTP